MKVRILTVGKPRSSAFRDAHGDYAERLKHYCTLQVEHVKGASTDDGVEAKRLEGERLLARIDPRSTLIALDERGKMWSSVELAQKLDDAMLHADSDWTFVIGGAFGLDRNVRKAARHVWSLSELTFPHELALVLLTEQVYRAFTILRNEPYHKS